MRRTKHRCRFHTERVIRNRQAQHRREGWGWFDERPLPDGRLADRQAYFGCSRAHCLLCHGEKFLAPRRTREKRAWLREVDAVLAG